jgi:hypothetical protein
MALNFSLKKQGYPYSYQNIIFTIKQNSPIFLPLSEGQNLFYKFVFTYTQNVFTGSFLVSTNPGVGTRM